MIGSHSKDFEHSLHRRLQSPKVGLRWVEGSPKWWLEMIEGSCGDFIDWVKKYISTKV